MFWVFRLLYMYALQSSKHKHFVFKWQRVLILLDYLFQSVYLKDSNVLAKDVLANTHINHIIRMQHVHTYIVVIEIYIHCFCSKTKFWPNYKLALQMSIQFPINSNKVMSHFLLCDFPSKESRQKYKVKVYFLRCR